MRSKRFSSLGKEDSVIRLSDLPAASELVCISDYSTYNFMLVLLHNNTIATSFESSRSLSVLFISIQFHSRRGCTPDYRKLFHSRCIEEAHSRKVNYLTIRPDETKKVGGVITVLDSNRS